MRLLWTLSAIAASTGLVVFVYLKWLRPLAARSSTFGPYLDLADTHRARAIAWLKTRWVETSAAIALALPEIPDLLTELSLIDLSSISAAPFWAAASRVVGVAALIARFTLLTRRAAED